MPKIVWRIIAPYFRGPCRRISFPAGMLTNVSYNYVLYDSTGTPREGARTLLVAVCRRKETGWFIAKLNW